MNHIKFEKSTVIDVDMDADGGEVFNIAREDLDKKTHFKVCASFKVMFINQIMKVLGFYFSMNFEVLEIPVGLC